MNPWVLFLTVYKLAAYVPSYNLSSLEMEVGGSKIQEHTQLYSKFTVKLGCKRPYLKKEIRVSPHTEI